MLFAIRQYRRVISALLVTLMVADVFTPTVLLALTGGPSQPEVMGFQPIGVNDMVDLFTGDFSYNIPLLDVDGYPINLAYSPNPGVDDEASWVGLGWSLNPGVLNRDMRGYPDDFRGDTIQKSFNQKDNITIGGSMGARVEVCGFFGFGVDRGLYWNSSRGWGKSFTISPQLRVGDSEGGITAGLGLTFDTQNGVDVSKSLGIGSQSESGRKFKADISSGYNTRSGLSYRQFSASYSKAKNVRDSKTNQPLTYKDKKDKEHNVQKVTGGGVSATESFGNSTYFPTSALPFRSLGVNYNFSVGPDAYTVFGGANVSGYVNTQKLVKKHDKQLAYGYFNSVFSPDNALLDYNKTQELVYREDMKNLPLVYGTYDLFSASGQGVSGQFRAARNDIGVFRSVGSKTVGNSLRSGAEVGFGALFHAGGTLSFARMKSQRGLWKDQNNARSYIQFTSNKPTSTLTASNFADETNYEPFYFKNSGEVVITESDFDTELGNANPVTVRLERTGSSLIAREGFSVSTANGSSSNLPSFAAGKQRRMKRAKRNTSFSVLTANEARHLGLDRMIKNFPLNKISFPSCSDALEIDRVSSVRLGHHISEATVLKSDGARYVYGIPAYNRTRQEATFSVDPTTADITDANNASSVNVGMIPYAPADMSIGNSKGKDNYYESSTIPAYAHSYLLTAVLSPDYMDKTGNGISEDDLGNAVRLNYSMVTDTFKWRLPIQQGRANYNEGRLAEKRDDKASVIYGQKEIWHVHSIESKTMVAQFYISPRNDAKGVLNEHGLPATTQLGQSSYKLDSIKLFTKAELKKSGALAVAIKTVHFRYDYTLCPQVLNYSGAGTPGKLTLTSVFFTYGNSGRGRLNAYKFSYKTTGNGGVFTYNGGNTDRWGSYKRQSSGQPLNSEFPYATQVAADADDWAGAWCLNKIDLPSGATINVTYESDTYAYIQDKRAGQMLPIAGFIQNATTYTPSANPGNQLFSGLSENQLNLFAVVNVPTNLHPLVNSIDDVKARFFQDIKQAYFKVKMQLTDVATSNEWVSGYADFDLNGVQFKSAGSIKQVLIPLKSVASDKPNKLAKIHPLSSAGLQLLRLDLPDLAYPNPLAPTGNVKDDILKVATRSVNIGDGLTELFNGFDKPSLNKGFCKTIDISRAWIRLACPNVSKYGGGSRVKTISVNDNWGGPSANTPGLSSSSYGQEYTYTTRERINGVETEISSGVAAYEPIMGGEENTLRNALPYYETFKHAPDNAFYTETPVGENLYPSPTVGYSEVKVRTLNNTITRTGTGYTITKFFTARDYPTTSRFTVLSNNTHKIKHGLFRRFLKVAVKDHTAASQGFVVETNDMHGKLRQELVYNELGSLLKSTTNTYRESTSANATGVKLSNTVPVLSPNGTITTAQMGVDMDVWTEMNQDRTDNKVGGVDANAEGFLAFILPVAFPFPYPIVQSDSKMLRTSITTKFIKRFGILDEVKVMENGSTLTTKNVLFDSETGDVLLTQTQNEFEDPVYNFKYPAHWAYDGMGQACKNIGLRLTQMSVLNGVPQLPGGLNMSLFFAPGDEILARKNLLFGLPTQYTRLYVAKNQSGDLRIIEQSGKLAGLNTAFTYDELKIIRSGRRNLASTPIGEIASRQNPVVNNKIDFVGINPLQASATTFSDLWQMPCSIVSENPNCAFDYCFGPANPYIHGLQGNWRPSASLVFHGQREQQNFIASTTNIRNDGNISSFTPFWIAPPSGSSNTPWAPIANQNSTAWVQSNRMTKYDPRGNEIENLDPLGIYSSASFGYNLTRAIDITSNSLYQESASDNYEDFNFGNLCTGQSNNLKKVSFLRGNAIVQDSVAHTGKYAIRLISDSATQSISLRNFCIEGSSNYVEMRDTAFYKNCISCLEPFKPRIDSFFVSTWVATDTSLACGAKPPAQLEFQFFVLQSGNSVPSGAPIILQASGPVIDGWRRIHGKVVVPTSGSLPSSFKVVLRRTATTQGKMYADDFRIHNVRSNMKSFVYDPVSMRLMAQLDENNYATFYEYDDEGLLVRIKRESDKGIVTVQESRTVLRPNN